MGDTLASEASERLVEHGPIARRGSGGTSHPPAAVAGARPGDPGRDPGSVAGLAPNGRVAGLAGVVRHGGDEHDGRRLDRASPSRPLIGHARRHQRGEGHHDARGRGDRTPSDDGRPGPDRAAPAQPRHHRVPSCGATTSSVATASSR